MRIVTWKAAPLSPRTYALVLAGALAIGAGALPAASPRCARAQDDGAAEESFRRGHPELAYASALAYTYGYWDLAVEVLDALEKTRPPADVMSELQLARLDIQVGEVTSPGFKGDAARRQEVLLRVRKGYEELAKKDTEAGILARTKLGEMLLQEGDGANARMKATDDAEVRASSRKEAEEKYEAGRKYFDDLREKFAQAVTKAEDEAAKASGASDNPDADPKVKALQQKLQQAHRRVLTCRFNAARALYNMALLLETGSKDRAEKVAKCAELFGDINLEYGDQYLGYEAGIFLGLCCKELGRIDEASAAFQSVLGVKDFYGQDDQGHYQLDAEGQDLVSRASYFKAQMLNEARRFDEALQSVKDLFELMPALAKSPLGLAARVEQGTAIGGKGDAKKATELLEKVAEDAKGTYWAQLAKERIALLGSGGGAGAVVNAEKGLQNAKIAIDHGKVAEGLNSLRFLIAQLEGASPEDQQKWLAPCWLELGKAYLEMRRYDEAAVAFEALVARTKDKALAPSALFQEAMAYLQANGVKNNSYDKEQYLESLKKLQKDFPDDDAAKASSFFLGIERFSARDYVQAAKEFEKTGPSAKKLYDAALYQAGLSYVMEGRRLASDKEKKDEAGARAMFAQAQVSLKKAIDWASEGAFASGVPKDGDRAASLKKMGFDARCRLAEVFGHPLIKDADKALAAAQEAERSLGAGADPDKIAEARSLAVTAFLLADKAEKAEEIVASMGKDCPKAVRTAQSERDVGSAFDRLAEASRKASGLDAARPLFKKAADHLASWLTLSLEAEIDIAGRDGGKDLSRAADKLYIYAKILNGLDDEKVQSFVEVEDLTKLPDAKLFLTAAKAYGEVMKTPAGDWKVGIKLGQALGFARDYANAKKVLFSVCEAEKLLIIEKEKDEKGKEIQVTNINVKVAAANLFLIFAYQDYAYACFNLVATGQDRTLVDETIGAAGRIVTVSRSGQETWWRAKYLVLAALYEKGEYGDASLGVRQIERQNPRFDDGKFGLKERFAALKQKLEGKAAPAPAKGGGKK